MQRAKLLAEKIVEMMAEAQQRMAKGRAEKCRTKTRIEIKPVALTQYIQAIDTGFSDGLLTFHGT